MKKLIYFAIAALVPWSAIAQTNQELKWTITMKVVDEDGQPIEGANAAVGYGIAPGFLKPGQNNWGKVEGRTDTNGVFVASHSNTRTFSLGIQAEKDGYYKTRIEYGLTPYFNYNAANWNPTVTLVLKKIGKPIPMHAKRIDMEPPVDDKPVGYDLMVGDWVGPYGKGINTDIVFTREYHRKSLQDYDYKLTVSFPKADDGIQEFPVPYKNMEGSALRSLHEAPADGYQPQIVRLNVSHPGQKLILDYDENRVYFFRVRTVLDENGNVKSALYGKIYGDFMQFKYYLNPTPNDRNVEFDPKQNLVKGLKSGEGVDAP
jgi:hypothetical protein